MTLTLPLAAVLAVGTALGVTTMMFALATGNEPVDLDAPSRWSRLTAGRGGWSRRRLAVCVGVGLAVGVVTRWPVAALLSGLAAWTLPAIIGPDRDHTRRVARIEAIATWTEMIRDNLAGAAGLEQAITASATEAPEAIRDDIGRLALRLQRGWGLPPALRALAAELADPTGDAIVRGLLQAAQGAATQLGEVLGELAAAGRAKVASRQRIAASRKRNRTSARVIVAATLAMAAVLALIDRPYLRPFDTATGQLVLLLVGACFALAFWGLARLMRDRDTARLLAAVAEPDTNPAVEEVVR